MSDDFITLADGIVEVVVDAGRGADVLSVRHLDSDLDVLFSTPWREHADAIRLGVEPPRSHDPVAGYVEGYRGGWNTLCPNAGAPRSVHGAPVGFHGEAVHARWQVLAAEPQEVRLSTRLFTVPVSIERRLTVAAGSVLIQDEVHNESDVELEIDYVSHPAFGGAFLDGRCTVDTNAGSYHVDPDTQGGVGASGSRHSWPFVTPPDGHPVDLREVPAPGQSRMAFGWLADFDGTPWASITNHDLGLAVRIDWQGTHQPYAWFWQELNWMPTFPWHRRARAFAIEPSSTTTSGPDRRSVLSLAAGATVRLPVSLTLSDVKE